MNNPPYRAHHMCAREPLANRNWSILNMCTIVLFDTNFVIEKIGENSIFTSNSHFFNFY